MTNHPDIPFVYGPPVYGNEFVNHEFDLSSIFNRIRSGQSSVVVGEPHIGKSSILFQILDQTTCKKYLGEDKDKLIISFVDLHPIEDTYTIIEFWEDVLKPIKEKSTDKNLIDRINNASNSNFNSKSIVQVINYLEVNNFRLLLLLDEFDRLLFHPNFQSGSFYAFLRSLNQKKTLVIVLASRLNIAKLHSIKAKDIGSASPFFNTMIDVRIKPFDDGAIKTLLERAADAFSIDDKMFIQRMAGRNPFLLQAMAGTFLEIKANSNGNDVYTTIAKEFYNRISFHFDDLWTTLDDNTRTVAVILSLIELGKRALGQSFSCGEIENIEKFGPQLQDLAELGLAEQVKDGWQFDIKNLMLWRGQKWTVSSQAFVWWIRDVAILNSRPQIPFENWLEKKHYILLGMTNEQWNWLVSTIRSAPVSALSGAAGLVKAIIAEMVKKK